MKIEIFLADDDLDDCQIFEQAIAQLDVMVDLTIVHDGEQLGFLLLNSKRIPDIIFLDLNMPRKNGFEVLSEIRNEVGFKHIPVIIYSTSSDQQALDTLYKGGANYFIRKPPTFSKIKSILEKALQLALQNSLSQPARDCFVLMTP